MRYEPREQIIMVYKVPYLLNASATTYEKRYSKHDYELYLDFIPMVRSFGAHYVNGTHETAYAFHTFGDDKILWSDMDG